MNLSVKVWHLFHFLYHHLSPSCCLFYHCSILLWKGFINAHFGFAKPVKIIQYFSRLLF